MACTNCYKRNRQATNNRQLAEITYYKEKRVRCDHGVTRVVATVFGHQGLAYRHALTYKVTRAFM